MKTTHFSGWSTALCGVLGALALALMLAGAALPIAMFIAPALAGLMVMAACEECGRRMAWTLYAAVSILGVLLVPDRDVVGTFIFLVGYYPLLKPRMDRIGSRVLRTGAKVLLCNLAILAMYALLLFVFPAAQVDSDLQEAGTLLAGITLLVGNIAFLLYDKALANLLRLYRLTWQKKLHRMLGR